ncbi:urease accessory protein UreF [Salinarimonas ramus]|uniref:Urease accessory protein UreF n=1 Tax=Salinarimonas ramus TaxID=690164 RepID=A0A917Q3W7_9HYPH|nr:urease accessory protein UreF [Salinarimonas ramus]GGK19385.1 urease accessory protein UreF [Salinarimonas ramus]
MALSLPLLIWTSPSFPVGAFAYSHGLEWAQEAGDVTDAESLASWLGDLLAHGAPRNDAILCAEAWRGAQEPARLAELAELAVALSPSAERRLETITQGNAFLSVCAASWPCPALDAYRADAGEADTPLPVAFGLVAAGHGLPLDETLDALGLGFVQNLVSAAVRLGIVGQTRAQAVVASLLPTIRERAEAAAGETLDDLGSAVFRADLGALLHETQYTRLFRS